MEDHERLADHEQRLETLEAAAARLKPIVKRNTSIIRSFTILFVFLFTIVVATISPKWSSDGTFTLETRGLTIEAIVAGAVCVFLVVNKNSDVAIGKVIDRFMGK